MTPTPSTRAIARHDGLFHGDVTTHALRAQVTPLRAARFLSVARARPP